MFENLIVSEPIRWSLTLLVVVIVLSLISFIFTYNTKLTMNVSTIDQNTDGGEINLLLNSLNQNDILNKAALNTDTTDTSGILSNIQTITELKKKMINQNSLAKIAQAVESEDFDLAETVQAEQSYQKYKDIVNNVTELGNNKLTDESIRSTLGRSMYDNTKSLFNTDKLKAALNIQDGAVTSVVDDITIPDAEELMDAACAKAKAFCTACSNKVIEAVASEEKAKVDLDAVKEVERVIEKVKSKEKPTTTPENVETEAELTRKINRAKERAKETLAAAEKAREEAAILEADAKTQEDKTRSEAGRRPRSRRPRRTSAPRQTTDVPDWESKHVSEMNRRKDRIKECPVHDSDGESCRAIGYCGSCYDKSGYHTCLWKGKSTGHCVGKGGSAGDGPKGWFVSENDYQDYLSGVSEGGVSSNSNSNRADLDDDMKRRMQERCGSKYDNFGTADECTDDCQCFGGTGSCTNCSDGSRRCRKNASDTDGCPDTPEPTTPEPTTPEPVEYFRNFARFGSH